MNDVTVSRTVDAPPTDVRAAMADLEPFMRAAGFDRVTVEGSVLHVANDVGIVTIELTLAVIDDPDAALVYEQREGIFEEMRTAYTVTSSPGGTTVEATTTFALDLAFVGDVLDATVIERQRRAELTAQLDWLEDVCTD